MGYNKKLPFFIGFFKYFNYSIFSAILKRYLCQHFVKFEVFLVAHSATIRLTPLDFWLIKDDKVAYLLGKVY